MSSTDEEVYPTPPDLQTFLAASGGLWQAITAEQWRVWDARMARWHRARRLYTAGVILE